MQWPMEEVKTEETQGNSDQEYPGAPTRNWDFSNIFLLDKVAKGQNFVAGTLYGALGGYQRAMRKSATHLASFNRKFFFQPFVVAFQFYNLLTLHTNRLNGVFTTNQWKLQKLDVVLDNYLHSTFSGGFVANCEDSSHRGLIRRYVINNFWRRFWALFWVHNKLAKV